MLKNVDTFTLRDFYLRDKKYLKAKCVKIAKVKAFPQLTLHRLLSTQLELEEKRDRRLCSINTSSACSDTRLTKFERISCYKYALRYLTETQGQIISIKDILFFFLFNRGQITGRVVVLLQKTYAKMHEIYAISEQLLLCNHNNIDRAI